jgi:hypothetical protein
MANNDNVIITNKKALIEWLNSLQDDAVFIYPVWGVCGQVKCPTKMQPNPSIDIRLVLSDELIRNSKHTTKNLYNIHCHPIMWVNQEQVDETLTPQAIEIYQKSLQTPDQESEST